MAECSAVFRQLPANVSITANAAGLATGTYIGTVTITAGGQTTSFPVGLSVLPPASLTASPSAIAVAAVYSSAAASGWDVQIAPAGVAFTASASASSSSWLSFSPASGTGPAAIHVVIDPSKAIPGTYQDSIVIASPGGTPNSPMSIPVKLEVGDGLFSTLAAQVASATAGGPDHTVAPNELVSLFLTDFNCSTQPVVAINGTPVPWSAWSPGQVNYAVPATFATPGLLSVACNGDAAWSFYGLNLAADTPAWRSESIGNGYGCGGECGWHKERGEQHSQPGLRHFDLWQWIRRVQRGGKRRVKAPGRSGNGTGGRRARDGSVCG